MWSRPPDRLKYGIWLNTWEININKHIQITFFKKKKVAASVRIK
jgi:hypothetical protein